MTRPTLTDKARRQLTALDTPAARRRLADDDQTQRVPISACHFHIPAPGGGQHVLNYPATLGYYRANPDAPDPRCCHATTCDLTFGGPA